MSFVVKAKTLFDNVSKQYQIDFDIILKKGMLLVGTTCFGEDLVEISCPKRKEILSQKSNILTKENLCEDKKNNYLSFEPKLLRIPKQNEVDLYYQNLELASSYKDLFLKKICKYQLDMKIVHLYYPLNKDKLICTYTANQRIDFRSLVKDLGSHLAQRIELYQIHIKDAFSFFDGCGTCGHSLCCTIGCTQFLYNKNKNVRSSKMLGVCGKGKCCLFFESE